jgi:DNA-binding beta-propeller fold protein YncE
MMRIVARLRHEVRTVRRRAGGVVWWSFCLIGWAAAIGLLLTRLGLVGAGAAGTRSLVPPAADPMAQRTATPAAGQQAALPAASQSATAVVRSVPAVPTATPVAGQAATFFDLAVDESRQRLYASENDGGRLFVFSLPSLELVAAIPVGPSPRGIDISPDQRELAVAVSGAGQIAIFDLQTLAITARVTPDVRYDRTPDRPDRPIGPSGPRDQPAI